MFLIKRPFFNPQAIRRDVDTSHYGQVKEEEKFCGKVGCKKAGAQASHHEGQPENSRAREKDRAPSVKGKFTKHRLASSGASWVESSRKEAGSLRP
jgi:hypothetical protein